MEVNALTIDYGVTAPLRQFCDIVQLRRYIALIVDVIHGQEATRVILVLLGHQEELLVG